MEHKYKIYLYVQIMAKDTIEAYQELSKKMLIHKKNWKIKMFTLAPNVLFIKDG